MALSSLVREFQQGLDCFNWRRLFSDRVVMVADYTVEGNSFRPRQAAPLDGQASCEPDTRESVY